MEQTLEQIADRIVICGLPEIQGYLESGNIGAIVTACTAGELKRFNDPEYIKKSPFPRPYRPELLTGQELIDLASSSNIPRYQSLLYQSSSGIRRTLGIRDEDVEKISNDEWDTLLNPLNLKRAIETMEFIDHFFQENDEDQIIIHCAQGSDRSALIAIAYMFTKNNGETDIDSVLRQLQRRRPRAALDATTFVFNKFLGSKFDDFCKATDAYRSAIYSRAGTPSLTEIASYEVKGAPSLTCLKSYFDDMAQEFGGQSSYFEYVTNCNRFGISISGWRENVPFSNEFKNRL